MNRIDWYGPNVWSWNPLAMLCTPVGAGCARCWHRRQAPRLAGKCCFSPTERAAWAGTGPPVLRDSELEAPLRRRRPSVIAVQFMGDLFHETVPDYMVREVWWTMALARRHTFLVLTKRPARLGRVYGSPLGFKAEVQRSCVYDWPLRNVFVGLSASTQEHLEERAMAVAFPAAGWWLSLEPLLGPVDLARIWHHDQTDPACSRSRLDWVVVGAETGRCARPLDPEWVRAVRDYCVAAHIPFYIKQADATGARMLDGRFWDEVPWTR